jgi:hypothetical protein
MFGHGPRPFVLVDFTRCHDRTISVRDNTGWPCRTRIFHATRTGSSQVRNIALLQWEPFIGVIALMLAACDGDTTMNVGELKFQNELNIPPLLEPKIAPDGTKQFTLTMQPGTTEFIAGKPTPTGESTAITWARRSASRAATGWRSR